MKTIKQARGIFWALSLCVWLSGAHAEDNTLSSGEESTNLDTETQPGAVITVTATRIEKEVLDVPASVSVISADDIEKRPAQSPEELLKNEVGVDLAVTPGGAVDRVILRGVPEGFSGNTTQYLLNGMPVDAVQISTNRTIWQLLSTLDIERIEVVRGPSSALYGANAMGGVINIITKRGSGEPFVSFGAEGGSHDGKGLSLEAGGSFGDWDIRVSGRGFETEGYRSITESSWPGVLMDYDLSGRESKTRHLNGRLTWWPTESRELSVGLYHNKNSYDWLGGHPNQRSEGDSISADFLYSEDFSNTAKLKFKLLSMTATSDVYIDNSYWDIPEDLLALEEKYRDDENATSAELQFQFEPFSGNTLVIGGNYSIGEWELEGSEWWNNYPSWTPYSKSNKSRTLSLFIQDELKLGSSLAVTLGGRYDHYKFHDINIDGSSRSDINDSIFNPRAGINYRINKVSAIYASAGTGYIPANPGLIYRAGGSWLDNPDLKPESSTSWETGLKIENAFGWFSGSLALFRTDYEDRITTRFVTATGTPCSVWPCFRQYQNVSKIRIDGAEVDLRANIARHWHPFINYTRTKAEIVENPADPLTEGNRPAYIPRHKFNAGLEYVEDQDFMFRIAGRRVSTRYWSDRQLAWTKMDSFFVVDTKLTKQLHFHDAMPNVSLSLAVNNLFNEEYSEWQTEMADGRNWWLELAAEF